MIGARRETAAMLLSARAKNHTGSLFLVLAIFLAVPASGQSGSGKSTLCRFTSGPRNGQTQDNAQMGPIPIGSPCADGAGSIGVIVAPNPSSQAPRHLPPQQAPQMPRSQPSQAPPRTLTGRELLVRSFPESAGYGLYSYVLFGSTPNDVNRSRYESAFKAFFQTLEEVRQLEGAGMSRQRLNITYLPVANAPSQQHTRC